ncbi:Rho termination factor N-terminal domain-containing protein [Merismopedia glauca]|uniref:Rho termination factor-like N-terminal domain-containing protein n=1 Tax=Merismopedia glauca CCAP 1448/3 TaxID=1296344 RepID=A0A2T1C9K6_9CYAN|nr:Rho termination factor N-terminal domain-containing protein [Merismopedia glauca]PSB04924.1 hypothetical protein C7B64_01465 [Merismopedia glauca CCAP 1448/3]
MKNKALLTALIASYAIYILFYIIALIASTLASLVWLIITAIEKQQAKNLPPVRFDLHKIDEPNPTLDIPDPWMLPIDEPTATEIEIEPVHQNPIAINRSPKLLLLPPARNIETQPQPVAVENLESKSIRELKKLAKQLNIKGYNQLKKAGLIERIKTVQTIAS